jgi:hypothetical protein
MEGMEKVKLPHANLYCHECAYGKLSTTPFPQHSTTFINRPLSVVSIDICGPLPPSINNK